jgi:hypothetical protein
VKHIIVLLLLAQAAYAQPKITFSADEHTVNIQDGARNLSIPRPVCPAWNFNAPGRIFWISPNGNDSNLGTQTAPMATLQRAINLARPGDCVYCLPGTYHEASVINGDLGQGGRKDAPLIISCAPVSAGGGLGTAIIQIPKDNALHGSKMAGYADSSNTSILDIHNANYVTVNGLTFTGALNQPWAPPREQSGNPNGLMLENGPCTGCRITNCVSMFNLHCGFKDQSGGTDGVYLAGNLAYRNGRSGLDHGLYMPGNNCTIDGDIYAYNTGFGLSWYANPNGLQCTHLLTIMNDQAPGGGGAGGICISGKNGNFSNCTCYEFARSLFFQQGAQAKVDSCIGWGSTAGLACDLGPLASGVSITNSDFDSFNYGNPPPNPLPVGEPGPGCLNPPQAPLPSYHVKAGLDPLFLSPSSGDYRLQFKSPCLGTGSSGSNMGCY